MTFTAPGSDPTAALSTPAVTGANGQTRVTATAGMVAGAYSVTVTAPGANTATVALNNTTGLGTIVIAAGNNQSAVVGESFSLALVVRVADQFGNGVSGVAVNYTRPVERSDGSLGRRRSRTRTERRARRHWPAPWPERTKVTATASGIGSVSFTLTNVAGVAASVVAISGTPQSAVVANTFGAPLLVEVEDQYGNAVSGATVIFTAPGSGATASLRTRLTTDRTGNERALRSRERSSAATA